MINTELTYIIIVFYSRSSDKLVVILPGAHLVSVYSIRAEGLVSYHESDQTNQQRGPD